MKNIRFLIFLLFPFFLFSQETEKRLALVIGNSNYDKEELKNPVNDARLIASTLDSLDFDVILKENLSTKRDMTAAIREFGNKRSEYDVAFVYYAGHGIQVDDENFLLPTKEVFEGEFDVLDYGVSVQNIMRYLRAQTNEVNILILDACRDNPFESKWNTTRSLKSQGLAKIPPPTGSLIAFSTDSGKTAPDGDGENSTYTISLAKNMLLEDTSIDQVFRNVRAEVLAETNGNQRPVEATQLTGQTFYLVKTDINETFDEIFKIIDSDKDLYEALGKVGLILDKYPENEQALSIKSRIFIKLDEYEKALEISNLLIKIKPDEPEYYINRTTAHQKLGNFKNAVNDYKTALKLSPNNPNYYYYLGDFYKEITNDTINAIVNYKEGLALDATSPKKEYTVALHQLTNNYNYSLEIYSQAIKIDPNNFVAYRDRANLYAKNLNNIKKALIDYNMTISLSPNNPLNYFFRGNFYRNYLEDYSKAIKDYNKGLKIDPDNSGLHYEKAITYKILDDIVDNNNSNIEALINLSSSIEKFKELKKNNHPTTFLQNSAVNFDKQLSNLFKQRGLVFEKLGLHNLMCDDFNSSISYSLEHEGVNIIIEKKCSKTGN
jgi:tetratricopeptide (TPR) repeat protein